MWVSLKILRIFLKLYGDKNPLALILMQIALINKNRARPYVPLKWGSGGTQSPSSRNQIAPLPSQFPDEELNYWNGFPRSPELVSETKHPTK